MSATRRGVARRLRRLAKAPVPAPPGGLAARIKAEIPAELAAPRAGGEPAPRVRLWSDHRWRLAAALVMTVAAGSTLWWLRRGEEFGPQGRLAAPTAATKAAPTATPDAPLPAEAESKADYEFLAEAAPAPAPPAPKARRIDAGAEDRIGSVALNEQAAAPAAPVEVPAAGRAERVDTAPAEPEADRGAPRARSVPPPAQGVRDEPAAAGAPPARQDKLEFFAKQVESVTAPSPAVPAPESTPPLPSAVSLRVGEAPAVTGRAVAKAGGAEGAGGGPLAVLRRALGAGHLPAPGAVAVDDLVAAVVGVEPAAAGVGALAVVADGGPPPYAAPSPVRLLRFDVAGGAGGSAAIADVEFDPRWVATVRRVGGGEIRAVAGGPFRDVVEVAGAGLTLLYEVELRVAAAAAAGAPVATLSLRSAERVAGGGEPTTISSDLPPAAVAAAWDDAPAGFRLAALAAAFAEALGDPGPAAGARLEAIDRLARRLAAGDLAGDPRAAELASLATRAAELAAR